MLIAAINVTQAARAAAVTAAQDATKLAPLATQQYDAAVSANNEEGGAGSIHCAGAGIPSDCVSVADLTPGSTGVENTQINLAQVTVWQSVQPFIPLLPSLSVNSEATAPY